MPDEPSDPALPPLRVSVKSIESFFSATRPLELPWFQRAYAWDDEHAARLLSDIGLALDAGRPYYMLGHVLLAGRPTDARLYLIDGHQRAITLTILFALLRDRAPSENDRERLSHLVGQRSGSGANTAASGYRIMTQASVAGMFERYVQADGATGNDVLEGDEILSEVETRILENRRRLSRLLDEMVGDELRWRQLVAFLLERCHLVVEQVDNEDEAWTMLSVEETTGLPFHSTERLKISLIAAMPANEQVDAARRWVRWQSRLGVEALQRLIHHVRALRLGIRSNQPIEQELIRKLKLNASGAEFFDKLMEPNVAHLIAIREKAIGNGSSHAQISQAIGYMQWLEQDFWLTPALAWLGEHGADDADTEAFFVQLERLAWVQRMTSNDPIQHERKFIRLAKEITQRRRLAELREIEIDKKTRESMRNNLLSRTFFEKRYSRLVLRRICAELREDPGPIDGVSLSVEHILPRRPEQHSPWRKKFPKDSGKQYANQLGNLALLSFADNQHVGVKPYDDKLPVLAASTFAISRDAAQFPAWSPKVIEERTERLARLLFDRWQLPF